MIAVAGFLIMYCLCVIYMDYAVRLEVIAELQ